MKKWSLMLLFLAGLGVNGCTHKDKADEDKLQSARDVACGKSAQILCTREYVPTTCVFGNQEFSASNPCETKKLVREYACAQKLPYREQELACDVSSVVAKNLDCGEATICTREYQPKVCRFADLEAKGSNQCEALNALRQAACSKQLAFTDSQAACEAAADSPVPARSR